MSFSFDDLDLHAPPPRPFHQQPRFWLLIGGVALAAAIAAAQYYFTSHRTLHVVNGYDRSVEVRLATGEAVSVPPKDVRTLSLAEGTHQATIVVAGREARTTEFTVESDRWTRLFKKPAFVLVAAGGRFYKQVGLAGRSGSLRAVCRRAPRSPQLMPLRVPAPCRGVG
jgi:hypothetical protein